MFKPDCLERGLVGRILTRFEEKGLRLVAMKMLRITPAVAKQHYAEHVEKPFYPGLEEFITASPVVACVFRGAGSDSGGPGDARGHERPEGGGRHDPRRLLFEPADESRACLRLARVGRAREIGIYFRGRRRSRPGIRRLPAGIRLPARRERHP